MYCSVVYRADHGYRFATTRLKRPDLLIASTLISISLSGDSLLGESTSSGA